MDIQSFLYSLTVFAILLQFCATASDVVYTGRNFVYEGEPFTITCRRTEYGLPKWTKDGVSVVPEEENMTLTQHKINTNVVLMQLHVDMATLNHRGRYKCDPLSQKSHRIEIVPLPETDEELNRDKVVLSLDRPLKLRCRSLDNSVFPINWYKDGSRILSSNDERIVMEGKNLTIRHPTEHDAGEYLCAVEVSGLSFPAADHLGYSIQVTYPAKVEEFLPQTRPILGRNLTLECKVHGYPVPRVTWLVDGMPREFFEFNNSRIKVRDNADGMPNSILFIENVSADDTYVVSCVAENKGGPTETSTTLAVRANMINTNEEIPGRGIVLAPGSDLVLQCNTTDDPSLNVIWYKNNMPLNMSDSRIHIENSNNSLIIHHSVESDTGNYMCVVHDEEPAKLVNATIVVRTKVRVHPFDSSRNIVQGQSIYLHCNISQGTPPIILEWFKDNEPLNLSDSRIDVKDDENGILDAKLTINNVDFNDRAEYMCVASNDVSSSNTTILVRVKDKYAALWPFLGICAEVAILCTIIFVYEKRRQKPDFDESEADHTTENKTLPDQEEKSQDIRQRK